MFLEYPRMKKGEAEGERVPFSAFQYTFKSVIATSIEIDLRETPKLPPKYTFLPATVLHLGVFDSLLMARRNSSLFNTLRLVLYAPRFLINVG